LIIPGPEGNLLARFDLDGFTLRREPLRQPDLAPFLASVARRFRGAPDSPS